MAVPAGLLFGPVAQPRQLAAQRRKFIFGSLPRRFRLAP